VFEGLESAELLQPGEKAAFSWLRDGKPFDPEERFKVLLGNEEDSLALVFQHVRPEDAGLYTCVASTSTGRISCSAELSVMGKHFSCLLPYPTQFTLFHDNYLIKSLIISAL